MLSSTLSSYLISSFYEQKWWYWALSVLIPPKQLKFSAPSLIYFKLFLLVYMGGSGMKNKHSKSEILFGNLCSLLWFVCSMCIFASDLSSSVGTSGKLLWLTITLSVAISTSTFSNVSASSECRYFCLEL
jgi:hypothetical protein